MLELIGKLSLVSKNSVWRGRSVLHGKPIAKIVSVILLHCFHINAISIVLGLDHFGFSVEISAGDVIGVYDTERLIVSKTSEVYAHCPGWVGKSDCLEWSMACWHSQRGLFTAKQLDGEWSIVLRQPALAVDFDFENSFD